MHADDARRLYVDVAEPLARARRCSRSGRRRGRRRRRLPRPGADLGGAQHRARRRRSSSGRFAPATASSSPSSTAARPSAPATTSTGVDARFLGRGLAAGASPGVAFAEARLARWLRRAGAEAGRDPVPPPGPPPPRGALRRPRAAWPRLRGPAGRRLRRPRGPRRSPASRASRRRRSAGITRDYLELEYRGEDRVFAPTDQLAKITRYIGAGGDAPQLSALGSKRWEAVKARARRAARELAGELLNLYAERRARSGHAFEPDGEWELKLERASPTARRPTSSRRSRR